MLHSEEHTINFEIGAGMLFAIGMIGMGMHELAGTLVILAASLALLIIYTRNLFAIPTVEGKGKISRHIVWINYSTLTLSLFILGFLILSEWAKTFLLGSGLAILSGLTVFDLLLFRKKYFCLQISHCLVRNILLGLLMVLFYLFL